VIKNLIKFLQSSKKFDYICREYNCREIMYFSIYILITSSFKLMLNASFQLYKKSLSLFSWNANDANCYSTNVKTLNTKSVQHNTISTTNFWYWL